MKRQTSGRPCLFYAAGPGDVVNTFREWQNRRDDRQQVAITYSGQFFALCHELGARGVVISSNPRAEILHTDQFHVENRPKTTGAGWRYHLNQLRYLRELVSIARREQADVMIVADATGHLFGLSWMAPATMAIVPSLHCTLWPVLQQPGTLQQFFNRLARPLYSHRAQGILCVSEAIKRQVEEITAQRARPIHRFRPIYNQDFFATIPQPDLSSPQFHLLFAGRLEENKGIFDLLEICQRIGPDIGQRVRWHIAGDGSCEMRLRTSIDELRLGHRIHLYGHCQREKMAQLIGQAHAIVVPTRADFEEGFNKVVAEAILSARPVIASTACPANRDVQPALVEVAPGDIDGYVRAVTSLATDRTLYREKQRACRSLQGQFYQQANSWRRQLAQILEGAAQTGNSHQAVSFSLSSPAR